MLQKEPQTEAQFEITSIEQLDDYMFNLWPDRNVQPDDAKQKVQAAKVEAQKIIDQKGGLSQADLEVLGFYHKDKGPRNDW